MSSQRYKITIAYRGTHYHGWQTQQIPPNWKGATPEAGLGIPTVQETVECTLRAVVGHPVVLSGSSRTDAGVHARGQVAHFDTTSLQIPPEGLRAAVNSRLPADILISNIAAVTESFNSITSTVKKRYEYHIWNGEERTPFNHELSWHRWQQLNLNAMHTAGRMLVGEHDFASFAKPGHGRESTVRTVLDVGVRREGEMVIIAVEGTGFLWQMVRIIVGTLVEIGMGRYSPYKIPEMLAAKDRKAAGPTAPAHGLILDQIWFDENALRPPEPVVVSEAPTQKS